jgi:hypothetical protein
MHVNRAFFSQVARDHNPEKKEVRQSTLNAELSRKRKLNSLCFPYIEKKLKIIPQRRSLEATCHSLLYVQSCQEEYRSRHTGKSQNKVWKGTL